MPAPAVYVLAIVGTVGAVLVFKEFVYEPHIAPAIDRWKAEFQAAREARRRRLAGEVYQDESNVQMSETPGKSKGRPNDKYSDSDDDSDDDSQNGGRQAATTSHSFMRDGLLIRRPLPSSNTQPDVELDNLVAREVNEWRNEATGQVLRQRRNVWEHAMDESVQAIPYTPLSPSRIHVIADSSAPSPSTPTSYNRLPSPPPQQEQDVNPTGSNLNTLLESPETESPPLLANVPHEPVKPGGREASPANLYKSLPSPPDSQGLSDVSESITPEASDIGSPPPEVTPFQHMVAQSTLLARAPALSPTFPAPSASIPVYVPSHPLQHSYPEMVPSLSQSYPQDLDYEHDLELLSPPSSRSESPFSLAALSPDDGLRAFSPFGSTRSASASGISSGISSPSPLRMDLGNQSYDAISPLAAPQALSPFRDPPRSTATPSSTSNTYFSLSDDSSDDDFARPYAHLGSSTALEGTFGQSAPQPQPQETRFHQPAALHPSLLHGPYNTPPAPRDTMRLAPGTAPLFPVVPRTPTTPAASTTPTAASRTANAAVALGAGARDPVYFRPSSAGPAPAHGYDSATESASFVSFRTAQESDGAGSELSESDVDFVSDYAPSESDFGAESDSSWSMPAARTRGGARA